MNKGFKNLFWGFLLVFLDFRINTFDILLDPIGYILIFSGLQTLVHHFELKSSGKFASILAGILIVLSIPDVFIPQQEINQLVTSWSFYSFLYGILNILLVYFIFEIMLKFCALYGRDSSSVSLLMKFYIGVSLFIEFLSPFTINFSDERFILPMVMAAIIAFALHIVFIVYLNRFSKWPPLDDNKEGHAYDE